MIATGLQIGTNSREREGLLLGELFRAARSSVCVCVCSNVCNDSAHLNVNIKIAEGLSYCFQNARSMRNSD